MKVKLTSIKKARIEMLPLIDIVFLLLVFFIYAMLSMAVHRGLPVNLPVSAAAAVDQRTLLTVTVKEDGRIFVGKQPVGLPDLADFLHTRARGASNKEGLPGVLLFADRGLSYQHLFSVLDRIRESGLTRISLQAESPAK